MSARHLFHHALAEFSDVIGAPPDATGERCGGVFARWEMVHRQAGAVSVEIRWMPARPERVEIHGVGALLAATIEPTLMGLVTRPESALDGYTHASKAGAS